MALSAGVHGSNLPIGLQPDFLRNNTVLNTTEVANNVLRIKNYTGKNVRFHINYSIPNGWIILGNHEKEFEIGNDDSLFIPIRIIPDKSIKGGTSYVVTIVMISEKNVQFASQNWYISVPAKSNWSAHLALKHQFFINAVDSSGFIVHFTNQGNTDEEIRISLIPDRRLEVLNKSQGGLSLLSFTIPLAVGADTNIIIPVIKKPLAQINYGKDSDPKSNSNKENYSVKIIAKSTSGKGSWNGTVQFSRVGNASRFYDFAHSSIPLTLEANVYDILSNGTTMSLDAFGNMSFKDSRLLTYRFQGVFVSNYYNEKSFLGNNHYIGYFDERYSLELGEINGWGRSFITGRGIKGSYRIHGNTIGAMYTRSPGFFNKWQSEGFAFYHNLKLKRINWNNYFSRNKNTVLKLSSDIYNSFLSLKLNNQNQLSIGGGFTNDQSSSQKANGYGYDINYSGWLKKLNLFLGYSYGSPSYVLGRGINMFSTRTSWSPRLHQNLSFSSQNFTQKPFYFVNGTMTNGYSIRSDRYELSWSINSIASSYTLRPAYHWDENPSLRVATRILALEYNAKNISNVRFSVMGSMGYAKAVDYSVPDFFVSRISTYARWNKIYMSLRYTYGPVQLAEQLRFINDGINPQSIYLNSTYDLWTPNGKILLSSTVNLFYETYFKKINLRLRPEVYYYAGNGIRFSFYASIFRSSQGANPMFDELTGRQPFEKISNTEMNMGFGIKKQFGIPIPGKKYVTIRAIVFKDLNGNHKLDDNEEGVENILVNIRTQTIFNSSEDSILNRRENGEDFITNQKGEIVYENIPTGVYRFKCSSLIPNGEWFDAGENDYKIDSKQTIYIPLTRGVRINGALLFERDKYSIQEAEIDLANIRITAIDSSGKTYSVLTDRKGEFLLNLPSGQYVLSVNESAIGDNFVFVQSKINLDLSKNFEKFSITFNAIEKKRKMEIKKFNTVK